MRLFLACLGPFWCLPRLAATAIHPPPSTLIECWVISPAFSPSAEICVASLPRPSSLQPAPLTLALRATHCTSSTSLELEADWCRSPWFDCNRDCPAHCTPIEFKSDPPSPQFKFSDVTRALDDAYTAVRVQLGLNASVAHYATVTATRGATPLTAVRVALLNASTSNVAFKFTCVDATCSASPVVVTPCSSRPAVGVQRSLHEALYAQHVCGEFESSAARVALTGTGFHRVLRVQVVPAGVGCVLHLHYSLPPSLYLDLDELRTLQGSKFYSEGAIDTERPQSVSRAHSVLQVVSMHELSSSQGDLAVPLHVRYHDAACERGVPSHAAADSRSMLRVLVDSIVAPGRGEGCAPTPLVTGCYTRVDMLNITAAMQCGQQAWMPLRVDDHALKECALLIPVGTAGTRQLVASVTFLWAIACAALLLWCAGRAQPSKTMKEE